MPKSNQRLLPDIELRTSEILPPVHDSATAILKRFLFAKKATVKTFTRSSLFNLTSLSINFQSTPDLKKIESPALNCKEFNFSIDLNGD